MTGYEPKYNDVVYTKHHSDKSNKFIVMEKRNGFIDIIPIKKMSERQKGYWEGVYKIVRNFTCYRKDTTKIF